MRLICGVAVVAGLLLSGCSSSKELTSTWQTIPDAVESMGVVGGEPSVQVKGNRGTLSFRNDQDRLYIQFVTSDRPTQLQMIGLGFTVWLEGRDGKPWGIHAPVGAHEIDKHITGREGLADLRPILEEQSRDIQIYPSPSEEPIHLTRVELKGLKIRMEIREPSIVYQLVVPLKKTPAFPHALEVDSSGVCILRFETPEFIGNIQGGGSTRPDPGNVRGRGGASRPADPSANVSRQEPLMAKVKLTLARSN